MRKLFGILVSLMLLLGALPARAPASAAATSAAPAAAPPAADVPVNVRSRGAKGDGTTDDTAAFASAVAECNAAGGCVFHVPRGRYRTSGGFVFNVPVILRGDGVSNTGDTRHGSRVECTSATAVLFTFAALTWRAEDVLLVNTSGKPPTAGAGIRATHASLDYAQGNVENVWVSGFYDCIDREVGASWTMDKVVLIDPVRYGVRVRNLVNTDSGDWNMTNMHVIASTRSPAAGIRIEGSGGGKISGLKVNGVIGGNRFALGIDATPVVGTGILKISNLSIENVLTGGIKVAGWDRVDVENYQFGNYEARNASYALFYDSVTDSGYDNVRPYTLNGAGAPGVILNNCARIRKGSIHATGFNPWLSITGTYSESGYTYNNGWNSVAFQNGWADLGGYAACQYQAEGGAVWVKCAAQAGTVGSVMFTLPPGYRPTGKFFVPTYEGGAAKFVSVDASGQVKHEGASNGSVIFNFSFLPR